MCEKGFRFDRVSVLSCLTSPDLSDSWPKQPSFSTQHLLSVRMCSYVNSNVCSKHMRGETRRGFSPCSGAPVVTVSFVLVGSRALQPVVAPPRVNLSRSSETCEKQRMHACPEVVTAFLFFFSFCPVCRFILAPKTVSCFPRWAAPQSRSTYRGGVGPAGQRDTQEQAGSELSGGQAGGHRRRSGAHRLARVLGGIRKGEKYGRKAEQCINLSRRNSHRSVSKRFMPSPAVYFTGCWRIMFVVADRPLRKGFAFFVFLAVPRDSTGRGLEGGSDGTRAVRVCFMTTRADGRSRPFPHIPTHNNCAPKALWLV